MRPLEPVRVPSERLHDDERRLIYPVFLRSHGESGDHSRSLTALPISSTGRKIGLFPISPVSRHESRSDRGVHGLRPILAGAVSFTARRADRPRLHVVAAFRRSPFRGESEGPRSERPQTVSCATRSLMLSALGLQVSGIGGAIRKDAACQCRPCDCPLNASKATKTNSATGLVLGGRSMNRSCWPSRRPRMMQASVQVLPHCTRPLAIRLHQTLSEGGVS